MFQHQADGVFMNQTIDVAVQKYSVAARIFHWVGALLIVAAWLLIEQGDDYLSLHKAVGVSFLIWTVLRILNRLVSKAPPPAPMSKLQTGVAHLVHFGLYVAMLAMPLTGLLASLYDGVSVSVFGLFQIPAFAMSNYDLAEQLMGLHRDLIWPLLLGLVAAHILGALYHQFVIKDNLIARMR